MEAQNTIIVPWDFTPLSDYALEHAAIIAKKTECSITLLHVVEHKNNLDTIKAKLDVVANDVARENNIATHVLIEVGKIYKVIPEVASGENVVLVVMKTDGIKGMQKYIGSRAIKIMRGAKAPFIVIQDKPATQSFDRIVYPIDFRAENKELLSYIFYLNKFYKSKLFLFKEQSNDKIFKKKIATNLNFVKQILESKHIEFEIVSADGKGSLPNQVVNYAHKVNADLILIQLPRNLTLTRFLLGVNEQPIVANPYKIPVMTVNPKDLTKYAGFS
jgi:nucleotide-binding universal stress UspA family protein